MSTAVTPASMDARMSPITARFQPLTKPLLVRIMTEPANSIYNQFRDIFRSVNIQAANRLAFTEEGVVECDASVMDGATLAAGAVAVVTGVANPIRLAHAVMVEAREVFLVGEPATALARRHGLRVVPPEALISEAARQGRARPT